MFLGKKEISKNVIMNGSSEHDRSSCSSPRYLMETSPQHSPREEVSCWFKVSSYFNLSIQCHLLLFSFRSILQGCR